MRDPRCSKSARRTSSQIAGLPRPRAGSAGRPRAPAAPAVVITRQARSPAHDQHALPGHGSSASGGSDGSSHGRRGPDDPVSLFLTGVSIVETCHGARSPAPPLARPHAPLRRRREAGWTRRCTPPPHIRSPRDGHRHEPRSHEKTLRSSDLCSIHRSGFVSARLYCRIRRERWMVQERRRSHCPGILSPTTTRMRATTHVRAVPPPSRPVSRLVRRPTRSRPDRGWRPWPTRPGKPGWAG